MSATDGQNEGDSIPSARIMASETGGNREERVTTLFTKASDEAYSMERPRRGICVVINQKNFASQTNLRVRYGTDVDASRLKTTFEGLSFEVKVKKNLGERDFAKELERWSRYDHSDCDAFVLCILTHGERDRIYHTEGKLTIDELFKPFTGRNCPSLLGKPKLFFIQACRGDSLDRGALVRTQADSAGAYRLPSYADFLIVHSTVAGFLSWRNPENGSWFIQALCAVLGDENLVLNNDILSLLTMVNRHVAIKFESSKPSVPELDKCKQVPSINYTLTRRLILVPKSVASPRKKGCNVL